MNDYWLKQTPDKPLFDDLMWSKPENKSHAGKLLIIGGSTNGFAHTVSCYTEVIKAGVGAVRVLIPESTKKLIGHYSEDIVYGPATKGGGFSQAALAAFVESSNWSDAVLLSGELGNNSETTILFEKFLAKYSSPLIIASDAFEFVQTFNRQLVKNTAVTFILDFSQLQKLSTITGQLKPITSKISLVNLVEVLSEISKLNQANFVIEFNDFIIVACQGFVSTTNIANKKNHQTRLAANASVWYMQNPQKAFEALSCAAITGQND